MIAVAIGALVLAVSVWLIWRENRREFHLYIVTRNGEVVYRGNNMNAAKEEYKRPVLRGVSVQLSAHGKIRGMRTE